MRFEHDVHLNISRVLQPRERPSISEMLHRLSDLAAVPTSSVLIGLQGHHEHWTVLRKVGRATLQLFDSTGLTHVNIANCRMSYEPAMSARREHVIHPRGALRIRIP